MNGNRSVLWSLSSVVVAYGLLALPAAAQARSQVQGFGDYQRFEALSPSASERTRSEVREQALAALAASEVRGGDYQSPAHWTQLSGPALTRMQVANEAREATRLGLVPHGELDLAPTAGQA
jgi:hypothetical protein